MKPAARKRREKQRRKLSTLSQGKPLSAHVSIDVIGCRKQCKITRVQVIVAFVPAGEEQDFLARCRRVIISTEPIRAAEEIQDLAHVTPW